MKIVFALLLCINSVFVFAQNIQKTFVVNSTVDNLWMLHLKRDNSFVYTHWSGFSGLSTIDSGSYVLNKKQITFRSSKDSKGKFNNETYYLEKYRTKRANYTMYIHTEKKRFKRSGYILSKGSR